MSLDGALVVEVPNIAYWPHRLEALAGRSVLPPLHDVFYAADPFTGHHREYTERDLRDVLVWSGFVVDELETFNYAPPSASWIVRPIIEWPKRHIRSCRELLIARASLPNAAPEPSRDR